VSAVPGAAIPAVSDARVAALTRAARRGLWLLGGPARLVLIGLIRLYRASLSGWLGAQCRFHPSCSQYAEDAIRAVGAARGTALAVWRVARCGPFGTGGFDPAPRARRRSLAYDAAIQRRHGDAR
jgi:putative membrane protein insertion efficiency factor